MALSIADQLRHEIRTVLKLKGASLFKLGAKAGVNPAVSSRFVNEDERVRRDIRMETAAKLAKTLGLRLHHWPR